MDSNLDGVVHKDEFVIFFKTHTEVSDENLEIMFQHADKDNVFSKDEITFDEFVKFMAAVHNGRKPKHPMSHCQKEAE